MFRLHEMAEADDRNDSGLCHSRQRLKLAHCIVQPMLTSDADISCEQRAPPRRSCGGPTGAALLDQLHMEWGCVSRHLACASRMSQLFMNYCRFNTALTGARTTLMMPTGS